MTDISLNTTRGDISRANEEYVQPLDLLRLVNLHTTRNWVFKIIFYGNKNHIHISADPHLTEEELLNLLDGKIPILYRYEKLVIKIGDDSFVINPLEEIRQNHRATVFSFRKDNSQELNGQIKIVGYPSIPTLQRLPSLIDWIHENTWYGSIKYENTRFTFKVLNLTDHMEVPTKESIPITEPFFMKKDLPIVLNEEIKGNLTFISSPNIKKSIIRHARFGNFNSMPIFSEFWKKIKFDKDSGIIIEIDTNSLQWYTSLGLIDIAHLKIILNGISERIVSMHDSRDFKEYQEKVKDYRKRKTAEALRERQRKYREAKEVVIDEKEFMKEPTCETEVVALYMKLEAAGKIPFDECKVLEYTAKMGIDALGEFRIKDTEVMNTSAPVEFEYMLDNFWDHGHPVEQTKLIVCWNKTEGFDIEECCEGYGLVLRRENDWLYYIQATDRIIPVLFLSQIPAIKR
jgi:hypothetical protein